MRGGEIIRGSQLGLLYTTYMIILILILHITLILPHGDIKVALRCYICLISKAEAGMLWWCLVGLNYIPEIEARQ